MTGSKSKAMLMKEIQMSTFAIVETNQFLDSHPNDSDALNALMKYNKKRKEAIDEYEQSYGSLFIYSDTSLPYSYVTEPFPWETEV
ncbi:MAG: spore coat protein CotJB [Clostridia bacterium]|nr:spore coat protein CotJB [Clostridia bacterium]